MGRTLPISHHDERPTNTSWVMAGGTAKAMGTVHSTE